MQSRRRAGGVEQTWGEGALGWPWFQGHSANGFGPSSLQRGNPVLRFVRNVPWQFGDVLPDYVLGQSTCALFLRWALGAAPPSRGVLRFLGHGMGDPGAWPCQPWA